MDSLIISHAEVFRYHLPLKIPLNISGRALSSRDGFLIKLWSKDKGVGFGEIAPLPGRSSETMEGCLEQLSQLSKTLPGKEIVAAEMLLSWSQDPELFASVRFGLETAVLNLLSWDCHCVSAALLGNSLLKRVPVNALLSGDVNSVIDTAVDLINKGFSVFKLKVGSANPAQDVEKVQALSDILHNQGKLRLDANQSWSYEQACAFCKKVSAAEIEYFEEPFADTSRIPDFYKTTGIAAGLDESLLSLTPGSLAQLSGVKAVILKPTLLGGIGTTLNWISEAVRVQVGAVISSTFESGVGLNMLINIAAAIGEGDVPAGLDTLKWFESDLLRDPFEIKAGHLDVRLPVRDDDLEDKFLEKIV